MNEAFVTKNLFSKNISKKAEWDVNVPDNCPDVLKILYFTTDCFLCEQEVTDGEISARITACADILYIPENGEENEIRTLHTEESFWVKSELPSDFSFELCDIRLKKSFGNCVMLNSRKLGVRMECSLFAELFCDTLLPDLSEEAQVIFDERELRASHISAVKNERIPFSEQFTFPSSKSAVSEILCFKTTLEGCEVKPITNKCVFKGDIKLQILYLSENDALECAEFTSPFTEIIDISGMSDDTNVIFDACVGKSEIKIDQNGKINLEGTIVVNVKAFTEEKVTYACDAYCPVYEESVEKESLSYLLCSPCFCDSTAVKEVFCFDDFEISEVYFVNPDITVTETKISGSRVSASVRLSCDVIYRTDGAVRCDQKSAEIEFFQDIKNACDYDKAEITGEIRNFSFVIQGRNCIEIRGKIDFKTCMHAKREAAYVKSVQTDKTKKKKSDRACVVAYYPKKDERVFDICKKYNSDPEKVRFINSLGNSDVCQKDSCVIIE